MNSRVIGGLSVMISLALAACAQRHDTTAADPAFLAKLKSAEHYESTFPAPKQTVDLIKKVGFRSGLLNAIGREPREVTSLASGSPDGLFAMLSHLGGYGEIIWVDQWTNFPVKLPPGNTPGLVVVPRSTALHAALDAIKASGGCLIKAGKHRYLVAKISEREKYEAAIRSLGWLDGVNPPWYAENGNDAFH